MDIVMEDPEPRPAMAEKKNVTLQDYKGQKKPVEERNQEPQSKIGPHQSDLSHQIDSKEVVEEILNTQVSLPLRKILGASKELSTNLQDVIRYKNAGNKPASVPNQPASHQVYRTVAHVEDEDEE